MHLALNPDNALQLGRCEACVSLINVLNKILGEPSSFTASPFLPEICCVALLNLITFGPGTQENIHRLSSNYCVNTLNRIQEGSIATYRGRETARSILNLIFNYRGKDEGDSDNVFVGVILSSEARRGAVPLQAELSIGVDERSRRDTDERIVEM